MAVQWIGSGRVEFAAGKVAAGAKAWFYDAGTTTPRVVYQDNALSTRHPQPVPADGNGRFPPVYLPSGLAKVRVTTSGDVILYEHDNVDGTAPTAGGGGSGTTDPLLLLSTGDVIWRPQTGVRAGFVRGNARTIGSATSGATERANADTQALFEFLWNNLSDAVCPVVGGRGVSSASDWAANKQLTLPDWRGRALFGFDDMGNSAANRVQVSTTISTTNLSTSATVASAAGLAIGMTVIAAGVPAGTTITAISGTTVTLSAAATATAAGVAARFSFFSDAQTPGALGGEAAHTLAQAELPAVSPAITVNDTSTKRLTYTTSLLQPGTGPAATVVTGIFASAGANPVDTQAGASSGAVTATSANLGSGGVHNNMPPAVVGTYYLKL